MLIAIQFLLSISIIYEVINSL